MQLAFCRAQRGKKNEHWGCRSFESNNCHYITHRKDSILVIFSRSSARSEFVSTGAAQDSRGSTHVGTGGWWSRLGTCSGESVAHWPRCGAAGCRGSFAPDSTPSVSVSQVDVVQEKYRKPPYVSAPGQVKTHFETCEFVMFGQSQEKGWTSPLPEKFTTVVIGCSFSLRTDQCFLYMRPDSLMDFITEKVWFSKKCSKCFCVSLRKHER